MPWHILAPSAVACDIFRLRASAHLRHVSASFCNMEPMLQKERGQETCNASFLTPLSAYILCTTLFFMQCSLPYLFSFVKRFFNFSSSHVAFCRQISCLHENLFIGCYRGSAALMSKSSCAAAESIADAFCEWRGETGALTCGSSHVAFCRQISCSHENLPAEGYKGSAALMSKSSYASSGEHRRCDS